jgi:hypothetical protein
MFTGAVVYDWPSFVAWPLHPSLAVLEQLCGSSTALLAAQHMQVLYENALPVDHTNTDVQVQHRLGMLVAA